MPDAPRRIAQNLNHYVLSDWAIEVLPDHSEGGHLRSAMVNIFGATIAELSSPNPTFTGWIRGSKINLRENLLNVHGVHAI